MGGTLGTVNLDNIQTVNHRKSGNVIVLPVPTKDSSEVETFDMGGNQEVVDVKGYYSTTSIADTKTLVDALLALMDADQAVIDLVTQQTGTLTVRVEGIQIDWDVSTTATSVVANYGVTCVRTKA